MQASFFANGGSLVLVPLLRHDLTPPVLLIEGHDILAGLLKY
jgi:hypothetical protein